jgi:hypothetical protein
MDSKNRLNRRELLKSATAVTAAVGGIGFFRANAASTTDSSGEIRESET